METLSEMLKAKNKELGEIAKKVGIMTERNRIVKELDEADLPEVVWQLIRNIINPEE